MADQKDMTPGAPSPAGKKRTPGGLSARDIIQRFNRAKERRSVWESHWRN